MPEEGRRVGGGLNESEGESENMTKWMDVYLKTQRKSDNKE